MSHKRLAVGLRDKVAIRWAVIGLGRSGWAHLRQLENLPRNFEVVACYDVDSTRLDNVQYRRFTTWEDLSANWVALGLRGASVCTPIRQHADLIESIWTLEGNVLCEKPLSPSVRDVERLAHSCHRKSLFIVAQLLFEPSFFLVRGIIRNGTVGQLRKIRYDLHMEQRRQPNDFVTAFAPHYIQQVLELTGNIVDLEVHNSPSGTIHIHLVHKSNVETLIQLAAHQAHTYLRIAFHFDLGSIDIENGVLIDVPQSYRSLAEKVNRCWFRGIANYPINTHFGPGLRNQYRRLAAVLRQEVPAESLPDGLEASRLVAQILEKL